MTDEEHTIMRESNELARAAQKSSRRVEEYLFGKDEDAGKSNKPSRADMLDSMIFGFKVGKLGYRVVLGVSALFVAVGMVVGTVRGWWQ